MDCFASAEYQDDTYALPLDRLERYALLSNLGFALTPSLEARVRAAYTTTRDWDRRLWTLDYLGVTAFTRGETRSTPSFGGRPRVDDTVPGGTG